MQAISRKEEMKCLQFNQCHDGVGTLKCLSMLDGLGSKEFSYVHWDEMPAGVSIGLHPHANKEEIYFLVSGQGILTFDDEEYEMNSGDISLCKDGHSHAFLAKSDCVLMVIASRIFEPKQ